MYWLFRNLRFLFLASTMEFVTANDQCRTEVNIQGMAFKRSVFKRWSVATPHLCDVNFLSAPSWFYIITAFPLGSILKLPPISCLEIKASEGKNTSSGKYWLDLMGTGRAILINCDMATGEGLTIFFTC